MRTTQITAFAATLHLLSGTSAFAATDADVKALRQEIQSMKQSYEGRIAELESKLSTMEKKAPPPAAPVAETPAATGRSAGDAAFNPAVGVILNGTYGHYSAKDSRLTGFGVGEEGERGKEGIGLGESELNFSSNVDDKFRASLTASIVSEDGDDSVELEEAFLETLPGMGLPQGMSLKAGRALWTFGYLNEHHTHTDDFADRPLPYRAFLNNAFNDDGAQLSYILPTDLYSEIGGGVYRGEDYPYGSPSGGGIGAWSAYGRIGGDIGDTQSWRLGAYVLDGDTNGRSTNGDTVGFAGDSTLYATDLRYSWAPTGNSDEQEVTLVGEYFRRVEDGAYADGNASTGAVPFDGHASGWYAQAVYKFLPQWRVGTRYSELLAPDTPAGLAGSALDANGHNPNAYAAMLDWSNSEFSRVRLQYNREELTRGEDDNQFLLQYIMSIGAHGAHVY